MRILSKTLIALALAAGVLTGCEPPEEDSSKAEQEKQTQNYSDLTKTQEVLGMSYSPSRDTLNRFAQTWEEEGKVAYIYLFAANGQEMGYFVIEGLPVSYCASLTPPDKVERISASSVDAVVRAAPAIDGVYYQGANCQQMFGFDAVSGAFMEWTAGGSFNYFLSDQPLDLDMEPIGDASVEEVEKQKSQ